MALPIVKRLQGLHGYAAIIRRNREWNEDIVQYTDNGKLMPESCWSHCPYEESTDTAEAELRFLANHRIYRNREIGGTL